MSATADFLVEIGTEELPPKSLAALEQAFAGHIQEALGNAGLSYTSLRSFATPRRLAVLVSGLQCEQPPQKVEKRGPPVSVAFAADGTPTRAAVAFAEGCGVPVEALGRVETAEGRLAVSQCRGGRPARLGVAARHRERRAGGTADTAPNALGKRRHRIRTAGTLGRDAAGRCRTPGPVLGISPGRADSRASVPCAR